MSSESGENNPDIQSITVASYWNQGILVEDARRQENHDPFNMF